MPIRSIGPIRIPKFAMKRKKTKTTCTHSVGCERIDGELVEHVAGRAPPGRVAVAEQPDDGRDDHEDDRQAELLAPVPGAPAAHHVLVAQLLAVGAEEARPRDQPAEEQVGESAEDDHDAERREQRPVPRPAVVLEEPDEERGARQERDDRGGARELAPLVRELRRDRRRTVGESRPGAVPQSPSTEFRPGFAGLDRRILLAAR